MQIKINVTTKGTVQVAKIYKPKEEGYQRVVGLFDEEKVLIQQLDLNVVTSSEEVAVPNTSANVVLLAVLIGVTIVVIGVGIILYRSRKNKESKDEDENNE